MKKLRNLILIFALIIASLFSACAAKSALTAPTNLGIDVDNNLTWDEVAEARTYTVEIKNADDGETQTKTVKRAKLDLAFLSSGDYELRVCANSATKNGVSSDWSSALNFHMNYSTGCVYTLRNNDSEYEITQAGTSTTGEVIFEDEYRGKPVTMIAEGAFRGSSRVTGVILGKNVRSVGKEAFYNCAKLERAVLNDSLTVLGAGAFQNCNSLKTVNIPDGITAIGESTFGYCYAIESIEIGKSVRTIGKSAFTNCTSLKEIVLPDSVVSLGTYAFYANTAATKLVTGKNLQTIGDSAFSGCEKMATIEFYGESGGGTDDKGSLTTIGNYSFRGCAELTSVTVPETVTSIGASAFRACAKLEEFEIPESVEKIGSRAIDGTALATSQEENGYIYADGWLMQLSDAKRAALSDADHQVNINQDAGTTKAESRENLPDDLRGIAAKTFYGCDGLCRVTLPVSVKTVGAYAFEACDNLEVVRVLKDSQLRLVDEGAFYNSKNLYTATLQALNDGSSRLKKIGKTAFYNTNLASPKIPETVESIGKDAYQGTPLWTDAEKVVTASGWVLGFKDDASVGVVSMKGMRGIADYAFNECTTLTQVTDTDSLEYIGRSAFYSSSLSYIALGNVTEIREYTFYGCDSLKGIAFTQNITKIGRSAFYQSGLYNVNFTDAVSLKSVGMYAFFKSESINTLTLGRSITEIGDFAFYGCSSIGEVVLPDSLTTLGAGAFRNCTKLTKVQFGTGLKEIGEGAFRTAGLESVTIPDNVEIIGGYAFATNENLASVTIGNNVKSIGAYAFYGDAKLEGVTIPASVEKIGNYAFRECLALSSATIGSSVSEIGMHAFYWCDRLTVYTDMSKENSTWTRFWNSSYRPVAYSCTLSEDKSYVVSMVTGNIENLAAVGGASDPYRSGYTFGGWSASAGGVSAEYTTAEAAALPAGETLYAVWLKNSA